MEWPKVEHANLIWDSIILLILALSTVWNTMITLL
jgi:hypothetical protein